MVNTMSTKFYKVLSILFFPCWGPCAFGAYMGIKYYEQQHVRHHLRFTVPEVTVPEVTAPGVTVPFLVSQSSQCGCGEDLEDLAPKLDTPECLSECSSKGSEKNFDVLSEDESTILVNEK